MKKKAIDKIAYKELVQFLNEKLENAIIQFYDDEKEYKKMNQDKKCIYFDHFYKRDTGISLLEKYGFVEALKKKYIKFLIIIIIAQKNKMQLFILIMPLNVININE